MCKVKHEFIYLTLTIIIIICIFQYGIQKICGFTMYPDEFGYWASAANVVGYNWTEVASLGSYYSFGYSALLIPLLKIFKGGVVAYRAAIAVNMLFMCISVLLVRDIVHRLFPELDEVKCTLISGIAVLYPAWIFYMQMTLAEALLMFLFVWIVDLLICLVQRPRTITAIVLAVVLMYTYSVHMRTVAVVIACLITLLLWGLSSPVRRKQMLVALGVIVGAGILVVIIKRNVILSVFSGAAPEILAANDYTSQLQRTWLLQPHELKILAEEMVAKFFYLGVASFGIFYWALGWCLKETISLIKRIFTKQINTCMLQQWIAIFLLLTVTGEVLICTIYMHDSPMFDCLIYGRYNEFLIPVLMAAGIAMMLRSRRLPWISLVLGALSGMMLYPIYSVMENKYMEGIRGYFVVGVSYIIHEDHFDPNVFFRDAWIMGLILMGLTAGIIWIIKKRKDMAWLLAVIMMLEIFLGIQAGAHYTYKVNRIAFEDRNIAEKILENSDGNITVTYLDEGMPEFIDFQQMLMPELSIHVIEGNVEEQIDELGDFVITSRDTQQGEILGRIFDRYMISGTYILYYNHID